MTIPTEPIGSIPRTPELLAAMSASDAGALAAAQDAAVRDTIARLEEIGSPVVTDGEQAKPSFATYPVAGLPDLSPEGVVIPFADGHTRQLPQLTAGPFRYANHAADYLRAARKHTNSPVKQAVIAPSALSLLYPAGGIDGYPREAFLADLVNEAEADIRACLDAGAHVVQLDFTEARLSLKLDPSGGLLDSLIAVNDQVLERLSEDERAASGCTPPPERTRAPPTASTSTTPSCCPSSSGRGRAPSTSSWPASPTRTACWVSSPTTCRQEPASSSA